MAYPTKCRYPIPNYISTAQLSPSYHGFIVNASVNYEPSFFHQAVKHDVWRKAMDEEIRVMEANHTWSLVPLPKQKQLIDCKWVYKIKYNFGVERHKARLVAKGFTQLERVDYVDTFSLVAKMAYFKVLLTLASISNWHMLQLDINNAFLNGYFTEEIHELTARLWLKARWVSMQTSINLWPLAGFKRMVQFFSKVVIRCGLIQSYHSLFTRGEGDNFVALFSIRG